MDYSSYRNVFLIFRFNERYYNLRFEIINKLMMGINKYSNINKILML